MGGLKKHEMKIFKAIILCIIDHTEPFIGVMGLHISENIYHFCCGE